MSVRTLKNRSTRTTLSGAALALLLASGLAACGEEPEPASGSTASPTPEAPAGEHTDGHEHAALVVEDAWVRATTGSEDPSMTAAFMVLDNEGEEQVTVTGASSRVAGRVELHEMADVDGDMVMREIDGGIVLEPGRGQLLQPGGSHVMLMDLTGALAPGDEVDLVLELVDGGTVEVTAPVKEFTEEEGHYHSPGTGEHEH